MPDRESAFDEIVSEEINYVHSVDINQPNLKSTINSEIWGT